MDPDVPQDFRLSIVHSRAHGIHDRLNRRIVEAAGELGWSTSLIPAAPRAAEKVVAAALEADAVVIAGGEDVDPRLYAGDEHYEHADPHDPRSDRVQIALVYGAIRDSLPLLGICRGMQVINVALGGALVPHLPRAAQHGGRAERHRPFARNHVVWDPDYVSASRFGERSMLEDFDAGEHVICTHHQGLGELGRGLTVAARALDGTVEAIVGTEAAVTGVQWHPEHAEAPPGQMRRLLARLSSQRAGRGAPGGEGISVRA